MKKVYISLINFNGLENTKECLASLEKITTDGLDIIVIVSDNHSKEPFSIDQKKFKKLQLIVIKNKENLGFSGGHNKNIIYALSEGAEYVLVLNNDTLVHKDFLLELVNVAKKEPLIGVVTPKIYFAKGSEYHKERYKENELGNVLWYAGGVMDRNNIIGKHRGVDELDSGKYDTIASVDYATGCCTLFSRAALEKSGLFDERYFLYYEDADICERIKKSGFLIYFAPQSVIWHKNAGAAGGSGSVLQDYYTTRNRLLYGMTYATIRTKIALARESLTLLLSGRQWQRRGVIDFYLKRFGKGTFQI